MLLRDYREMKETFDRIASLGTIEHVGPRNYRAYMDAVHRSLVPGGLALVHQSSFRAV